MDLFNKIQEAGPHRIQKRIREENEVEFRPGQ
jgi:hypothetical protein